MERSLKDTILKALKKSDLVDKERLEKVVKELNRKKKANMIQLLTRSGVISDRELLNLLSSATGIPPIDVSRVTLTRDLMDMVSQKIVQRHSVLPLASIGNYLTLVIADPTDVFAIDDVKTVTGCSVELVLAAWHDIDEAIRSFYKADEEEMTAIISEEGESDVEVLGATEAFNVTEVAKESKAAPIVKMVDLIISEAMKKRASDIHIEPQEKGLKIRYRIDGELHDAFDLPKKNQNAIITRLKIMSNLDITETRIPQDGRFRIKMEDKEIDFRVSSLPITSGNKIVLRALDKSNLSIGLEALGFLPEPLADFKEALARPFGIILVTGPTGSGKSTTLYSVLNEKNTPDRNIITIEDPVEYQIQGITQIAAHPEIGLGFAQGLRAVLRQSPDIIMVGEIRDFETADIAIKASLTGQMVLSTLHTNDAVGAITRLVNMGIDPFLISSSLVMACAQRLLRRICQHCKVEAQIPREVLDKIRKEYPEARKADKFYKGAGCQLCNGTGYRGRMGTLETLLVDDKIKEMISKSESESVIRQYLISKGVRTLRQNAMMKFIKGWTTLEEVYRVT